MIGTVSILASFEERLARLFSELLFSQLFWLTGTCILLLFLSKQKLHPEVSKQHPSRKGRKIYNAVNRRVIFEAQEVVTGINRLGAGFAPRSGDTQSSPRSNTIV